MGIFSSQSTPNITIPQPPPPPDKKTDPRLANRSEAQKNATARRNRAAQAQGTRAFRIDLNQFAGGSGVQIPGRRSRA